MKDGVCVECMFSKRLLLSIMTAYIPKVSEKIIINKRERKIVSVEHILNQDSETIEKFVIEVE